MNSDLHTWLALTLDDMEVDVFLETLENPIPPELAAFRANECQDGRLVAAFDDEGLIRCEFVRHGLEPSDPYTRPSEDTE